MSKNVIYKDSNGNELARKVKGRGRPPKGDNVEQVGDDIIVKNCSLTKVANARLVDVNGTVVWVPTAPVVASTDGFVVHNYVLKLDGTLEDEGVKGRGRPKRGYEKVEDSKVIDGVHLQGHFLFIETAEEDTSKIGSESTTDQVTDQVEVFEAETEEADTELVFADADIDDDDILM